MPTDPPITAASRTAPHTPLGQAIAEFQEAGDPPAQLSPRRFIELLGMDLQTLAAQAHVHRNTLTRAPGSPGVQRFLREVLRVLKAAEDVSGDRNRAIAWYRNEPLAVFDYKTAERLVAEGRSDDVLRFVASFEAGAAG